MSKVEFDPHQENIGNLFFCVDNGQSPKLTKNSKSGKNT